MFSKTHGLILLTLLLLLLSVGSVCAADNVSAVNVSDNVSAVNLIPWNLFPMKASVVNVSDNVSGNISEANVSESNVFSVLYLSLCEKHYDTQIEVDPSYLSGSDGDFINFTARVYYSGCVGYNGDTPIYDSGQCFGGSVSLYEDGKLINSTILSKDNDGAASFSFKFKAGHRYRLVYHGYSPPGVDWWGDISTYERSHKYLNITTV